MFRNLAPLEVFVCAMALTAFSCDILSDEKNNSDSRSNNQAANANIDIGTDLDSETALDSSLEPDAGSSTSLDSAEITDAQLDATRPDTNTATYSDAQIEDVGVNIVADAEISDTAVIDGGHFLDATIDSGTGGSIDATTPNTDSGINDSGTSPAPVNWTWSANTPTELMFYSSHIYANGYVWAIGGRETNRCQINSLKYNPYTDTWLPGIRSLALAPVVATAEDYLIALGGVDCNQPGEEYDHSAIYSLATESRLNFDFPQTLVDPSIVYTGQDFIIVGGQCTGCPPDLFSPSRLNPNTLQMTALSSKTIPGDISTNRSSAIAWFDGKLSIYSGDAQGSAIWTETTDEWNPMPLPNPVVEPLVWANTGTQLLVWDGKNGAKFDLASEKWSSISSLNAPNVVGKGVWTDTEWVILWPTGGAHYDPKTDVWRPAAREYAQWPKNNEQPIWTGSEVIIHGGNSQGSLNKSSRYGPRVAGSTHCNGFGLGVNIQITTPTTRTIASGQIIAMATVQSDIPYGSISWYLDGTELSEDRNKTSITLSTNNLAEGSHVIRAEVLDSANNITCHDRTIFVDPPPAIEITSPVSAISTTTNVRFQARCTDSGPCTLQLNIPGYPAYSTQNNTLDHSIDLSQHSGQWVHYSITAIDDKKTNNYI